MTRKFIDLAASVHQRLLNKARESSLPFNELLQYFAIERFLYRLSRTTYADSFVLKGALMFLVWGEPASRPTRDIDLLGRTANILERIIDIMRSACETTVEEDGIVFYPERVTAEKITEDAGYEGIRVHVPGGLGNAIITLQIDIGFGDIVIPNCTKSAYPPILDFPVPVLNCYSKESFIAEKFQAMVKLGTLNSRMKDFYDIWKLSRLFDFEGRSLASAIEHTFIKRNTAILLDSAVFRPSFVEDKNKTAQWRAFIDNARLADVPDDFEAVVSTIKVFLKPLIASLEGHSEFRSVWKASGPWR